jgi:F-box domain
MADIIPIDILRAEILARLDIMAKCRARLVCKLWRSVIQWPPAISDSDLISLIQSTNAVNLSNCKLVTAEGLNEAFMAVGGRGKALILDKCNPMIFDNDNNLSFYRYIRSIRIRDVKLDNGQYQTLLASLIRYVADVDIIGCNDGYMANCDRSMSTRLTSLAISNPNGTFVDNIIRDCPILERLTIHGARLALRIKLMATRPNNLKLIFI